MAERRLLWCINLFQIAISHTLSFQQFKFKSKHREWKCAEENVDFRPFLYLGCWQFWWYVAEESMWYKIWIKWSPACNLLPLTHMVVLICKLEVFTNFPKSGIWVVFLRIWLYKSRVGGFNPENCCLDELDGFRRSQRNMANFWGEGET